jgi:hypothetical protein
LVITVNGIKPEHEELAEVVSYKRINQKLIYPVGDVDGSHISALKEG